MVLPPDDSTDPLPEPPELPAFFAPAFAAACWALWAALDCLSAHFGYSKGKAPRLCVKSFSSCFLGYWARVLLLRLFSFTAMTHAPHRQCPASCAKGLVRCFGRAFLHSASPVLPAKVILQKSKYDQCPKTLGNLSVFPQRTIIKFGAAGVCILAGFVVKYIQSIYKQQT